jgi:cell division protein FtsI/penicillin-binding protein 2
MKSEFSFRTNILLILVLLFSLILVGKLFLTQIVHRNFYADEAIRQYVTPASNIFERGTIFFTKKDGNLVSGATQASGFKLAITPKDIKDQKLVYQKLATVVDLDEEEFFKKANKKEDPYEELAYHLTKTQADAISAFDLTGVKIFKEKWRFYPGNSMAAHTLGFVAYSGDSLAGRYGLERTYNKELTRDKDNPYVNFFAEVFSNINKTLFKGDSKRGDIVTTIEPSVQSFLEKELANVRDTYNADSIGGIIMNPTDGSIYALSSLPSFDLNNFSQVQNPKLFSNPLVENVLEFGSVVKPIVMASALDAGVLKASTTYTDTGSVIVEKREIFNFDKKGRGPGTSMQDVLNQSLNTGMVFAYQKLGKERMRDYMLSFGIKEKTGIDLPNETSGLVANLNSPRELEYANAAFGQGIALTPVELVRALSALSNGGILVTPHLGKKIKYDDGTEEDLMYPTKQTKISKETSEEITRMLVTVMDKSLKGGLGKIDNYSIAIKTGTAQVANNVTGGYYEDRNTHSFFGYLPAYDPKFIVFLYAVNPKGVPYAAQTWADPFLRVVKFLINYYELPPDR